MHKSGQPDIDGSNCGTRLIWAALREGTRFVYDVVLRIGATNSPLGHATTLRIEQDIRYVRLAGCWGLRERNAKDLIVAAGGRVPDGLPRRSAAVASLRERWCETRQGS